MGGVGGLMDDRRDLGVSSKWGVLFVMAPPSPTIGATPQLPRADVEGCSR